MTVDRRIGDACVEMRGFDGGDFAPVGETWWRDVAPVLAAVPRKMNQSSVASGPNQFGVHGRRCDCIDHAIAAGFGIFDGQRAAGRGLASRTEYTSYKLAGAGEIGTDFLPVKTAVGSLQHELRAVVERVVDGREYQRRGPGKTILAL